MSELLLQFLTKEKLTGAYKFILFMELRYIQVIIHPASPILSSLVENKYFYFHQTSSISINNYVLSNLFQKNRISGSRKMFLKKKRDWSLVRVEFWIIRNTIRHHISVIYIKIQKWKNHKIGFTFYLTLVFQNQEFYNFFFQFNKIIIHEV